MSSKIEIKTDEITYQDYFYEKLYGPENNIKRDRSTDGYTDGILFEHKLNVTSYGEAKALSQAIIYLTRFNRDGVPVPKFVCLVSQEEEKCFIYDMENYLSYINNIEKYANLKASDGIPGFQNKAGKRHKTISYNLNSFAALKELNAFLEQPSQNIKVDINVHNVYGWANFYYDNANSYKQKPEKKAFFNELKNPIGTLSSFINPWRGHETDFKYIMDILNDPATQKDLGAYYTPPIYAKKAIELVKQAIARVPDGNDYVIIDRCAGTGNLEMYLEDIDEDVLSHVIISTYELKEWMVLKDRFGSRVRYIIPPIPNNPIEFPKLNEDGFLSGANALTFDIINNPEIQKYYRDEKCTIIMFENPPFVEGTEVVKKGDKTIVQKKKSDWWKKLEMARNMTKEVSGVALNEMGNVFIWSAFKYFLRQPTDSYIVFSPIKYWKAQHLIEKKFCGGFAFNRKHFHADNTCVTCIYWSNEEDKTTHNITLKAFDIEDNKLKAEGDIVVKQVFSTFSEMYYEERNNNTDTPNGIVCELNGNLSDKKPIGVKPINNTDIIGYMVAYKNTFDKPRFCSMLLRGAIYNGHGFYLTSKNFIKKLPLFAASRYTDNCNNWKVMSMVMKSGDKKAQYENDVNAGLLDGFLCKCLIWTGLTHYAHLRNLVIDGKIFKNELCFDGNTLANKTLKEFVDNGYIFSEQENDLFEKYNLLLEMVRTPDEEGKFKENFIKEYHYGLFQIDEEINLKDKIIDNSGKVRNVYRYGDMNNLIKDIKNSLKEYYIQNIVPTLFEYEFLK